MGSIRAICIRCGFFSGRPASGLQHQQLRSDEATGNPRQRLIQPMKNEHRSPSSAQILLAALAGLSAVLVGNGLGRFAYTPLLPSLFSDHWFSPSAAAYLGAANLAGYLAGALLGYATTRYVPAVWLLRGMMALTAASLLACAARDLGFAWFFLWRFAAGYAGGVLMVVG